MLLIDKDFKMSYTSSANSQLKINVDIPPKALLINKCVIEDKLVITYEPNHYL